MRNNDFKRDIIDNAYDITMDKHPDYSLDRLCGALKQFVVHYNDPRRANGFSKPARDDLNTLAKEDIYTELLKNIVRLKAFRDAYDKRQALAISDYFYPEMHPYEQDEWLFHQIMYYPLEGIDDMMIRNEEIMNSLVRSFVDSRYFSYNRTEIDDEMNLTEDEAECLAKIDGYYDKYRYKF